MLSMILRGLMNGSYLLRWPVIGILTGTLAEETSPFPASPLLESVVPRCMPILVHYGTFSLISSL